METFVKEADFINKEFSSIKGAIKTQDGTYIPLEEVKRIIKNILNENNR